MPALLLATALFAPSRAAIVVDLLNDTDVVRIDGEDVGDRTGEVTTSCDANGDGIEDLVVTAWYADGPGNTRGEAGETYVIHGRRGAWRGSLTIVDVRNVNIIGEQPGDMLGYEVACDDLNGDGLDDMVMCAWGGDGADDSRPNCGQAHIVFGGPALPPLVDLASAPSTVIYGEEEDYGAFCQAPKIGDLNGDGTGDLALDDTGRAGLVGTGWDWGRVYLLFGSATWPNEFDLRTDADATIYGREKGDALGANLALGDLDVDGTSDLIVGAKTADGPQNKRSNSGEIYVFRGRGAWPSQIDLASSAPDMLVFGVDADDLTAAGEGLALGDLDHDGSIEIEVGTSSGDGPGNQRISSGEVRIFEPGWPWPLTADLRNDTDSVIWGAEIQDFLGQSVRVGEIDGDGTDDLVASLPYADGPADGRPDAGGVIAIYGRSPFPRVIDLADGGQDILVYGAQDDDEVEVLTLADLNGDGLDEIVASGRAGSTTLLPAIWLISPLDVDGDGITQLPD
ncbi:MAG: FG-GAP repeat protein, partial [Acidobacteria bacterium]|nr:FG-GAP repeat protein [Acidobacteriota bacterium]